MSATRNAWGELSRRDGRVFAKLKRRTDHSPARVWSMLTGSANLANWLAPGTVEQWQGGSVKIDFEQSGSPIDSYVRAIKPERLLEYSWSTGDEPQRPVRWTLIPDAEGTTVELTLLLPDDHRVSISCAGWDAHLEMLMASLEGIHIHFPADRFREARAAFSAIVEEELAA
ncbi:SRPBCC domain-containing protein [Marinobacter sp. TBZ242]|uniref:SRPBCC domain-containing protein n=1 Tax=Marinobacter azerbaijanicus TaxID=3050455 RepID=A0ABT7IBH3_9GAMM|nr:SRPBCC domain-containing protein [Marinobacter sp. TBZ242]MDL0431514.1 SRPBCC domain-containing protein [Marinobacter sp. TBZ242]